MAKELTEYERGARDMQARIIAHLREAAGFYGKQAWRRQDSQFRSVMLAMSRHIGCEADILAYMPLTPTQEAATDAAGDR